MNVLMSPRRDAGAPSLERGLAAPLMPVPALGRGRKRLRGVVLPRLVLPVREVMARLFVNLLHTRQDAVSEASKRPKFARGELVDEGLPEVLRAGAGAEGDIDAGPEGLRVTR